MRIKIGLKFSARPAARVASRLASVLVIAGAMIGAGDALAQSNVPKSVRMLVPFGPGTGLDVTGRGLSTQLSTQLGVAVSVENREGAGGAIAASAVQAAQADGSVLLFGVHPPFLVQPMLMKTAGYDAVKGFTPIAKVASVDLVLVAGKDAPFSTFDQFVDYVRTNPGKVTYGYPGLGTGSYLDMERMRAALRLDMLPIGYKTTGQIMTDVIAGQVHVWLPSLQAALPFSSSGQLKILAVGSPHRYPALPNVPTLAEGTKQPGFLATAWYGVFGPAGMKPDLVEKLNKEIATAMATPAMKTLLEKANVTPNVTTAEQFAKELITVDRESRALIDRLGLKPE